MGDRNIRTSRARPAAQNPLDSVERIIRLRQEAGRILGELFAQTPGGPGVRPQGPRITADVCEGPRAFLVSLEVPGVSREALSLYVVGSSLIVEGRKHEERIRKGSSGGRVAFDCAERVYGDFRRVVELPGAADTSRVEAHLCDGILSVVLPKISERRGRRREVQIG